MAAWNVLIRDHHQGYLTWAQFEEHQTMLRENAHMQKRAARTGFDWPDTDGPADKLAEEIRELALVTVGLGGHGPGLGVGHFRAFGRSRGGGSRSRRSGLRGCAAAAACQQQSGGKAHGAKGAFGGVAHRQKVSFRVSPYLRNSSGRKAWVWAALPSAVSTEK